MHGIRHNCQDEKEDVCGVKPLDLIACKGWQLLVLGISGRRAEHGTGGFTSGIWIAL